VDEPAEHVAAADRPRNVGGGRRVRRHQVPAAMESGDLAAKDGHLVVEHEDLGVLGHFAHPLQLEQLDEATDQAGEKAERHGQPRSPAPWFLIKIENRVVGSFRPPCCAAIAMILNRGNL
jgi:hypothetical protein